VRRIQLARATSESATSVVPSGRGETAQFRSTQPSRRTGDYSRVCPAGTVSWLARRWLLSRRPPSAATNFSDSVVNTGSEGGDRAAWRSRGESRRRRPAVRAQAVGRRHGRRSSRHRRRARAPLRYADFSTRGIPSRRLSRADRSVASRVRALTDHRIVKLAFPTGIESDGSGPLLPLGAFGVCALNWTVSR